MPEVDNTTQERVLVPDTDFTRDELLVYLDLMQHYGVSYTVPISEIPDEVVREIGVAITSLWRQGAALGDALCIISESIIDQRRRMPR